MTLSSHTQESLCTNSTLQKDLSNIRLLIDNQEISLLEVGIPVQLMNLGTLHIDFVLKSKLIPYTFYLLM